MTEWGFYQKKGIQALRPYVPGEDLAGVSVSEKDTPGIHGQVKQIRTCYSVFY